MFPLLRNPKRVPGLVDILVSPDPFVVRDTERIRSVLDLVQKSHDSENLVFPRVSDPEIYIVIPVHNQLDFTRNCLTSLHKNTTGSYELILIDDCSSDETANWLALHENIRIIRNERQSGFLFSCNRCLYQVRGRFIVFLNNDTLVTDNWLEPLRALMADERTGAAGARLVYPDGTLQEAGGIVWADGSARNYGRGSRSGKPWHTYVRPADYCSGAALMVRSDLFHALGGFDRQFAPAYYEDTDLCFSVWNSGYRVMYQPASLVVHFEGSTGQKHPETGSKTFQQRNKEQFFRKWQATLGDSHLDPSAINEFRARNHRNGKNILVLDHHIPTPDRDSGSHRMSLILQSLIEMGHSITFIESSPTADCGYAEALQQAGIEVLSGRHALFYRSFLRRYGKFYDLVILSRLHVALKHFKRVKNYCPRAAVIYDTVDLEHVRVSRHAALTHDEQSRTYADRMKKAELRLASAADRILTVSEADKKTLLEDCPHLSIQVLPDIYPLHPPVIPYKDREDLLFVGGFNHHPNTDAMAWFLPDIFPRIRQSLPGIRVLIIGENPPEEILAFAGNDVIFLGHADDLRQYLQRCRIAIAPLRYGSGLKGKIIQSMSNGLPLVTTAVGAEGAFLRDGENALIADDAQGFARSVARLYQNQELWENVSAGSSETVQEHFSKSSWQEELSRVIEVSGPADKRH
jgi:GT2 family glycosyltransferase/glycosyltransferase involved in cell wall biosynthesis